MAPTRSASDWRRDPEISSVRKAPEVCALSPPKAGNRARPATTSMEETLPRFMPDS